MGCFLVIVLVIGLIFVGFGFLVHLLWIAALIFLLAWIAGMAFGRGRRHTDRPE
ncbi:MAG TPA: hypothetical protein VK277_08905 [Acidimicrobiales bacterium]|nr:hypothetical protein [Acidimicrobiales bacterium]